MKNIIIADVAESNIMLSAFDFTNSIHFKLLSQVNVVIEQGMKKALQEIGKDIGPLSSKTSDFYIVTSDNVILQELDYAVSDLTH